MMEQRYHFIPTINSRRTIREGVFWHENELSKLLENWAFWWIPKNQVEFYDESITTNSKRNIASGISTKAKPVKTGDAKL
ncbi:hypothetical protein QFZ78_005478 [Paenibacillus sp. V4I5]|nr:hypothetical protein [Paenibacillus sp. V4I5]